ncbi:MAG: PDDEXK nuclease domain-containing protein [Nanoarchaeota archaeon]
MLNVIKKKVNATSANYSNLISSVGELLEKARKEAYIQINQILVKTYWEIGKRIVEYEQKGKEKAIYGSYLLDNLSNDLKLRYGKGFSKSNIIYMRLFYLKYPKSETLSHQLGWSHYFELLKIEDDLERSFYEKQCINENWSVRELKRQKNSALFERIALSKDKKGVLALAQKGHIVEKAGDLVKDPYVLEFLGIAEDYKYSEKELEQNVIDNLQKFLLELGKGFTFVARQFRISLGNKHYYVDLVFYHRILKCFVLIDLKIGEVTHADVGQMNMYLNYFRKEEMTESDNEPIGIILTKEKEKIVVEYALGGISNKLFVSKYKLYLPEKKELEEKVRKILKG